MTDRFAEVPLQSAAGIEIEKAGTEAVEAEVSGTVAAETGAREAWAGVPRWEAAADIWREVWIEEVRHSTGLSGNSLTRNEVERLLADGRAVGSRLLVEYLYVRGYGDASRWVCQQASEPTSLVTLEEICFLHEQTTGLARVAAHENKTASSPGGIQTGIQQGGIRMEDESNPAQTSCERPGRFREHELQASAEGITPVSWRFVPAEMEKWLAQANELAAAEIPAVSTKQQAAEKLLEVQAIQEIPEAHAIPGANRRGFSLEFSAIQEMPEAQEIQELAEALARSHSRFVKTQPFADANGLVARLAANLLLVRRGLPPAIIQKRQRSAYQQALQRADLGSFAQLADLFAQGIFRSLAWFAQPEPEEGLVPLSALATEEINVAALRVAAARGRLRAKRPLGGRWLSTPEWVADYIATRHRRQ